MKGRRIFLTLFLFLLVFFLTIVLISSIFVFKYIQWEETFEANIVEENVATADENIFTILKDRFSSFTLSDLNTQVLTLSPKEVGILAMSVAKKNIQEPFSIKRIYTEPGKGNWNMYIEISYKEYTVWFSVDLNKDNIQTAQLYVTNVKVGPYSLGSNFKILEMINLGIANSLLTVNENGFSGRYFENIELLEDSMVIKGSRY